MIRPLLSHGFRAFCSNIVFSCLLLACSLDRFQALFRGRRERKHITKRGNVAKELLATELTYIGHLKALVQQHLLPLRMAALDGKAIVSAPQLRTIFSEGMNHSCVFILVAKVVVVVVMAVVG